MDALTAFGLFAVTLMLVTYALEDRSPAYVLGFAAACALGSVYGFAGRLAVRRGGGGVDRRRPEALAWAPKIHPRCHIKVAERHEISVVGTVRG